MPPHLPLIPGISQLWTRSEPGLMKQQDFAKVGLSRASLTPRVRPYHSRNEAHRSAQPTVLTCPQERAHREPLGFPWEELPAGHSSAGLRPGVSLGQALGQLWAPPAGLLVQMQMPSISFTLGAFSLFSHLQIFTAILEVQAFSREGVLSSGTCASPSKA